MTLARIILCGMLALSAGLSGCDSAGDKPEANNAYKPDPYVKIEHPEWSRDAAIYEINTRQFTREGTFKAAEAHLPRLKDLGVDILWLMPIHEIGEKNRKGTLGSPYSVKDYYSVNPELGDLDDLRSFVEAAHALDMYVILDWVANHTAWDNPIMEEHPEWYDRDWKGDFRSTPWWDWSDIVDLNYDSEALRKYMTDAMKYWVVEAGIDGFRCDVAGYVPLDFWNNLRRELDLIKPVFMLAEWESRDLHAEAFDATYAWSWNATMHQIAMGRAGATSLYNYYSGNEGAYPPDSMRMTFVSNHDKNAWEGTQFEQFGDGLEAAIVLSVVGEGIPLVYSGQEAGNDRRLAFFEKDEIAWREHPIGVLYKKLFALKKSNSALWNGRWGATMIHVPNTAQDAIFSFVRQNEQDKVFVMLNLSGNTQTVRFSGGPFAGEYTDYFSGVAETFDRQAEITMEPWTFRVLVR